MAETQADYDKYTEELRRLIQQAIEKGWPVPGMDAGGGYPEIPEEWRNIVPPAPGGGLSTSGESEQPNYPSSGTGVPLGPGGLTQTSSTTPAGVIPSSQIPNAASAVPGQVASQGASQILKPSTSWLSKWLTPEVLVPAASAGSGVVGSLIERSAANKATDAQTEAADKSLALTEKMYEQDRADYAPYRNIGAYSLSQLGHLTGMPPDFGTQAVEDATQPRTAIPRAPGGVPQPAQSEMSLNPLAGPPDVVGNITRSPEFQSLRDLGAKQQSASSFVRMRAPDGEEADVDPREVAMFERAGARRIG
jgi:hypothetical protein